MAVITLVFTKFVCFGPNLSILSLYTENPRVPERTSESCRTTSHWSEAPAAGTETEDASLLLIIVFFLAFITSTFSTLANSELR